MPLIAYAKSPVFIDRIYNLGKDAENLVLNQDVLRNPCDFKINGPAEAGLSN